jgi:hypothetical protein
MMMMIMIKKRLPLWQPEILLRRMLENSAHKESR